MKTFGKISCSRPIFRGLVLWAAAGGGRRSRDGVLRHPRLRLSR